MKRNPFIVPGGIRCGVLGCGMTHKEEDSRIFRIGKGPKDWIPACPDCWKAMEIPMDIRDTNDLPPLEPLKPQPPEV